MTKTIKVPLEERMVTIPHKVLDRLLEAQVRPPVVIAPDSRAGKLNAELMQRIYKLEVELEELRNGKDNRPGRWVEVWVPENF